MFVISTKGSGIVHTVNGDMPRSFPETLHTECCHRELRPRNYFASVEDYQASYNANGRACGDA